MDEGLAGEELMGSVTVSSIVWLDEERTEPIAERIDVLGGKGAALRTLSAARLPVPAGFVVVSEVFDRAVDASRTRHGLESVWAAAAGTDQPDIPALARAARHLMRETSMEAADRRAIELALERWDATQRFAVRSSATPSAVSGPGCAGVHDTFLGVSGADAVMSRVARCWASLFSERALLMRSRGLGANWPAMAVVIQRMVHGDAAGVCVPEHDGGLVIEATVGLGEPIESAAIEPDRYVIGPGDARPQSVEIGSKRIVLSGQGTRGHRFATADESHTRALDELQVEQVRALADLVRTELGGPQEVEFAFEGDDLWVLQARDIEPVRDVSVTRAAVTGLGVGVGVATGIVRVVEDLARVGEVTAGDVLVTSTTSPEWNPTIERAGALVTDHGGPGDHAARIAREVGLPAVVGTASATSILVSGQRVTVDAGRGVVVGEQVSDTDAAD